MSARLPKSGWMAVPIGDVVAEVRHGRGIDPGKAKRHRSPTSGGNPGRLEYHADPPHRRRCYRQKSADKSVDDATLPPQRGVHHTAGLVPLLAVS